MIWAPNAEQGVVDVLAISGTHESAELSRFVCRQIGQAQNLRLFPNGTHWAEAQLILPP